MTRELQFRNSVTSHLVQVRQEPPGQFTAEVVGLPELRGTAASRAEAVEQVQARLDEWLASGRLVFVTSTRENASLPPRSWSPDDPLEQEFLDDLRRFRAEDLEHALRESEQECSGSSSTPTT